MFFLVLLATVLSLPIPFQNCGSPSSDLISVIALDGDWPLHSGHSAQVLVKAISTTTIRSGSLIMHATFDNIPFPEITFNLSKYTDMPIQEGPLTIGNITIPPLSKGHLHAQMVGMSDDGPRLFCVEVDGDISLTERTIIQGLLTHPGWYGH